MFPAEQILQLRTKPQLPGAQDVVAMNNRTIVLGALYDLDGRDDPDHPYHKTYTGLYRKYVA